MNKTLRVIQPFFICEVGDIFEYNKDDNMYIHVREDEFYKVDDTSIDEIRSTFNSEFKISEDYANELVEEGILEILDEDPNKAGFINVFDEINTLIEKYSKELKMIGSTDINVPACVRVERETVLTNLLTLLNHLKNLKK